MYKRWSDPQQEDKIYLFFDKKWLYIIFSWKSKLSLINDYYITNLGIKSLYSSSNPIYKAWKTPTERTHSFACRFFCILK